MPFRYVQVAAVAVFTAAVVAFSAYVIVRDVEPPSSEARDPVATSTQSETASEEPTTEPTPEPSPEPVTLKDARRLLAAAEPVVVSVLGDTAGAGVDWVGVWARDYLTQGRTVVLHTWDPAAGAWAEQVTLSTSGPLVEVWNYSVPEGAATDAAARLEEGQPEQPDLVLYDFGRGETAQELERGLERTVDGVARHWGAEPVSVLVAQNPVTGEDADAQERTVAQLTGRIGPDLGLPVIDVHREFAGAGPSLEGLLVDGTYPSEAGALLWARVVDDALR